MSDADTVLARGPFRALRDQQRVLAREGVAAEIVRPPGCDPNG